MKKLLMMVIGMSASVAMASYVDLATGSGALNAAATWAGGVLPSGSSTGLVTSAAGNIWFGNAWNNLAVRQTGGYVYNAGVQTVNLRGGLTGSGITTIYEIDDARTDYSTYTNALINTQLVMWSQYGEKMELSLLSGHLEVAALSLNAAGKGTVNMGDGILHAASLINGKANVNMLAGGTGDIVIDLLDTSLANGLYVNFETGNEGSFTFGQKTGGVSAGGTWQWLIGNGQVSIDGVVNTNLFSYAITGAGLSSTIAMIPEPATLGLIGLVGVGMIAIRRFVAL